MPIRFRSWIWKDETGETHITLRYSNRPLALEDGKPSIHVASDDKIVSTLELVKQAVGQGELDGALEVSSRSRRVGVDGRIGVGRKKA